MIKRLIAVILSALLTLTGLGAGGIGELADKVFSSLTGVPILPDSENAGFIDNLDDSDVTPVDSTVGYIDDIILVFLSQDTSVIEKYRLFRDNGLAPLGWNCTAGLFAAACPSGSLDELEEKCEGLTRSNESVLFASPVTAKKNAPDFIPNDPFEGDDNWDELAPSGGNWWLEAIDARQAWDYSEYFGKIDIGLLDGGFNTYHEELEGKISFPSDRQARRNRADSHGDHVAGIVGAKHDNRVGICGICENSELICVDWQPSDLQYWITDIHILFGFIDLVKAGSKVINLSLGSSGSVGENRSQGSALPMLLDASLYSATISSLLSKGYDFVVVQSAGNGNAGTHPIDAFYNGTFCPITLFNALSIKGSVSKQDIVDRIIIAAAAQNDGGGNYSQAYYSNVGEQVSLAAPGSSIYSCDVGPDEYCYKSGTSMAAPMITGVAALVWSVDPSLTGAQVKKILCDEKNTDAVAVISDERFYTGIDYMDYPMVNAKLSVEAALTAKYDMGRVRGKADGAVCVILSDGENVRDFTPLSDGSFDFVAESGDYTLTVTDGEGAELLSTAVTVTSGETSEVGSPTIEL